MPQANECSGKWKQYQPGDRRAVPMHKHPDISHSLLFIAHGKPFIMFRNPFAMSARFYLWRKRPDGISAGDAYALEAWSRRVLMRAEAEQGNLPTFRAEAFDTSFLRWLASLSPLADGPRLACDELREKGVAIIIEARLDHTHLDGAALLADDGRPVIGLTLRHNRLDNFWFTLFHELGHVLLHLSAEHPALLDPEIERRKTSKVEIEADRFALETCIASEIWEREVKPLRYCKDIRAMANKQQPTPSAWQKS